MKKQFNRSGSKNLTWSRLITLVMLFFIFPNKPLIYSQCTVSFSYCPSDVTIIDCDNSGDEPLDWPLVIANPNGFCTNFTFNQIWGPTRPVIAPVGQYLVGYSAQAQDINNGGFTSASCQFFVHIIKDLQPPIFTNCPPNIVVSAIDDGNGNCNAIVHWQIPSVSDDCSNTTLNVSHPCGSSFPMGTTNVTYTATDASGNVSICSFTVTVICIVGTNEPALSDVEVKLLPNPNKGAFTMEFREPTTSGMSFQIIDLTGRVILEQKLEGHLQSHDIELSDLVPGLYLMQIAFGGQVLSTKKFIKQ